MSIVALSEEVFVVLGIDAHEHDQVLGIYRTFQEAKRQCIKIPIDSEFYDLWVEKHCLG